MVRQGVNILIISFMVMLVGCYNAADKPVIRPELDEATTSIARLRSDVVGSSGRDITTDVRIRGRVVSSDSEQNIYGSIYVEDGTGGVEVMLGLTQLSAAYPEGLEVLLRLNNCYADYYRGVLQVGDRGEDSYDGRYSSVDYIGSRDGVDMVVQRGVDVEQVSPRRLTISDLSASICGCLVEIDDLHLVASTSIDTLQGQSLEDARWRGYSLFKDSRGDSIAVRTRNSAYFAESAIPQDRVLLRGIVEWGSYDNAEEKCYHIIMRYESDCLAY